MAKNFPEQGAGITACSIEYVFLPAAAWLCQLHGVQRMFEECLGALLQAIYVT